MTGTSGIAFRQAHEALSEESMAVDAAATSSVTHAEPLRFGGASAGTPPHALQTLQEAAHALRHASVHMRSLEDNHARIARQARAAGRGPADPARANRGADATDAELATQRRALGAKRDQASNLAAAARGKLDALHGAVESIERGLRKTEAEIERLSAQRAQLMAGDADDGHAAQVAALEGTIEAAQRRIAAEDKQLAADTKALDTALEAPKPALRRQEIRDRLTSMSSPQRSTEEAVDWLRASLYAALPPAPQPGRRGARAGVSEEQRIDQALSQLFVRPRPDQPYEMRLVEQDPVTAFDRMMNLCAAVLSTEQYRRIEQVVARHAVHAASQSLRGDAPSTTSQTAQTSLRERLAARFTPPPHVGAANELIRLLRESEIGARQERQWGMGRPAVHVGIGTLYRGLSANAGWLADAIAAKAGRYGAMLAVDEAEKGALRAGEYAPLIEARMAAAHGRKAQAQAAIDTARSEIKGLREARAGNLSRFTAVRAERIDALDLALSRARVKLEDDVQAHMETVEQYGLHTQHYATHSAKRDRIDTQIAAIDDEIEARRGAFRQATRQQAQVREHLRGEMDQARKAVDEAWHAVSRDPAVARTISPEALDRVIERHLGQTSEQMRERVGSGAVTRTATYRSRSDLLRSLADALDDALKRNPALLSAAAPADVERLGYLGARAEWLVHHDGIVGHGVRTGRGGQTEHPNAVASSYTLDWSEEGNAGAVRITHLYPWVPRR